MIENLLIYALIACVLYLVFTIDKDDGDLFIERPSDATIEVVGGRFILKEK